MTQLVLHADFDGTLFDPGIRIFLSPVYNQLSVRLMKKHNVLFALNTGRPVWDRFSDVQLAAVGIRRPDVVVLGCGTGILWKKRFRYAQDVEWQARIEKSQWNKAKVKEIATPILHQAGAKIFDTANSYMMRAWIYAKPVDALLKLQQQLETLLSDTKILLTEQILLPNTTTLFSGYILFIPKLAGKEEAARYINAKLQKNHAPHTLEKVYVGDACVDVPLLTFDRDANSYSYGISPTPLARIQLDTNSVPILEGSPPKLINGILHNHLDRFNKPRNSPYRKLVNPFVSLIDYMTPSTLTPNEISLLGLQEAQKAISISHIGGIFFLIKGYLMDLADGIRARRAPHLSSPDGQLIDAYADRMKEVLQLTSRGAYDAAISSLLPSIARAQAEAVGIVVPEQDPAGGSSLSRSFALIKSYFYYTIGSKKRSNKIDKQVYNTNMATFRNRRALAPNFSWNKLKSYDKNSVTRLLFLTLLLQREYKKISKKIAEDNNLFSILHDYLKVNVSSLQTSLRITFPDIS